MAGPWSVSLRTDSTCLLSGLCAPRMLANISLSVAHCQHAGRTRMHFRCDGRLCGAFVHVLPMKVELSHCQYGRISVLVGANYVDTL